MEHDEAVELMSTEKYLLDELSPELRDQFEEHFFGCAECASDLRAGAAFIDQSKAVLSEQPNGAPTRERAPASTSPGWFAGWRPIFAMSAPAVLLAVVAYQNLVTYPQLKLASNTPQVLPWASVNIGARGANAPVITAHPGEGFLLFVNIPPDTHYSSYTAELHDANGKTEWSLTIPAGTGNDSWPVRVPAADRTAGSYTLIVDGVTSTGESTEVGRSPFELQIQK
ncbi:MAG TPA: zf-HC2 domain-containing protein [Terriglobales bacterium]|nr:zf-HC2 domain-containing protein [Terriglobales bacterium]